MLRAELHGKLADDAHNATDRSEDVLTSNVFGSLCYVPPELALLPWLRLAEPYDGSDPLVRQGPSTTKVFFWPSVGGRQPDVLVELGYASSQVDVVIVECKYLSGKSQLADALAGEDAEEREEGLPFSGDQLADYLADARAGRVRHPEYVLPMPVRRTSLLFVTADASMPRKPLKESVAYLRQHHNQDADGAFYWLSWRSAWSVLEDALLVEADEYRLRLLRDLRSLLDRKGLRPFLGFGRMAVPAPELPSTARWRTRWAIGSLVPPAAHRFFGAGIFGGVRPPSVPQVCSWRMRRRWALTVEGIPPLHSVGLMFRTQSRRLWTRAVPPQVPGRHVSGRGVWFQFSSNSDPANASSLPRR
jgi:hypothetical protein